MSRQWLLTIMVASVLLPCSCGEDIAPRQLNLTGAWSGTAYGFSDIPEDPDSEILLTLRHTDSTVSGTLKAIGPKRTIYSGSFRDDELVITFRSEYEDVRMEFKGKLHGNRIEGPYEIRRLSNGELDLSSTWYVERDN